MAEEKFKLPGSSYEEVAKIIKGYGNLAKPASLDEISKLTSLHKTIVSRNAGFLIEIGVLDTGVKKSVTESGRNLARALEHEMPDEIAKGWLERVTATEFLTNLLTSIRIRKGMTDETLTSHIAYSAGQPKKSGHMTGARTIIDILRAAGCIQEADGKIVATDGVSKSVEEASFVSGAVDSASASNQGPTINTDHSEPSKMGAVIQTQNATVSINIELKVECTPSDLDDLGPKLRSILDNISDSAEDHNDDT